MREPTCEIKVKRGQNIEKSLRRLKKILDKEGVLQKVRDKQYYKKPSELRKEQRNQRRRRNSG